MLVLSKEQIKISEQNAVNSGVFSYLDLMHKAGTAAAQKINKTIEIKNKTVTVLCGNGNNGGDGFVIALALYDLGAKVSLMLPLGEPLTDSAKYYYKKCADIPVLEKLPEKCDIFIDAVFGIGLNKPLSQEIVDLFDKINKTYAVRIAIDIPSGIEADSGKILGGKFDADLTVTFIALKPCFLLPPASDYCGTVTVADIGVTPYDFTYKTIEETYNKINKYEI
jgi:NAD(P)H-hydrate epimerase